MKIIPPSLGKLTLWSTEAATVFLNGCIAGVAGGSLAGAGTGAGLASAAGGSQPSHLTTALTAAVLGALGNGVKRVIVWHDANPIPNPFVGAQLSSAPEEPAEPITPSGNFDNHNHKPK